MLLCAKTASDASSALAFASYLMAQINSEFTNGTSSTPDLGAVTGIAVGVILVATLLALIGHKQSNQANWMILTVSLISLTYFIITGIVAAAQNGTGDALAPFWSTTLPDHRDRSPVANFLESSALMFVAFTGYGCVATLGDEVRRPRTTLPRAIMATVLASTAGVTAVAIVTAPTLADLAPSGLLPETPGSQVPWIAVATAAFPVTPVASAVILALGAMAATTAVMLNLVLGVSRMAHALAKRGDLPPRPFAVLVTPPVGNRAAPVPAAASVLSGAIMVAIAVAVRGAIAKSWTLSSVTFLIYCAACNVAAMQMDARDRRYPVWVGAAGTVVCLGLAAFVDPPMWIVAGGLLGGRLLWHVVARHVIFKDQARKAEVAARKEQERWWRARENGDEGVESGLGVDTVRLAAAPGGAIKDRDEDEGTDRKYKKSLEMRDGHVCMLQ
ncbi:hypothetical protein AMAG_00016 [Allomyces macrogynus ATCC 38327]|uniref:Amino acid permease/ SLC12A domain-containing protein n=1 Tax=Allomyces macrogynus (strain ATCC 38327) TaxID=578462 RepID=A0A0L0RVC7_ALLM3|nr:hypothetical protein AMAG_00016 [Allomyces macrogynus ATCC 38327]|eukprot:KNE54020.1 hypothetical protein AMAG_00016 [Allomyces macrogynus ATCC 38327]